MTTVDKFLAPSDIPAAQHERAITAAAVLPSALVGTWANIDPATRGIVKIVIAAAATGILVHAYGACSPTPCDWGSVSGLAYAANVSSNAGVAFTATYNFGFKQTFMTGHLNGRLLAVETFDHFTDGSGRSDYYSAYTMQK